MSETCETCGAKVADGQIYHDVEHDVMVCESCIEVVTLLEKRAGARPWKCPSCEGWGKRQVAQLGCSVPYREETCRSCWGSGIVWGPEP